MALAMATRCFCPPESSSGRCVIRSPIPTFINSYFARRVRSSSGNRLLIEQQLADKPWKLDWFYEVRHLSTSLGLVEAGLGISALPGLAMPHAPYSSIIGIPLVEPVIRRTLGIIRRKDAVLSPAAERFFALLINLWTDDKDNLWTNIVERQRHALQEIG